MSQSLGAVEEVPTLDDLREQLPVAQIRDFVAACSTKHGESGDAVEQLVRSYGHGPWQVSGHSWSTLQLFGLVSATLTKKQDSADSELEDGTDDGAEEKILEELRSAGREMEAQRLRTIIERTREKVQNGT